MAAPEEYTVQTVVKREEWSGKDGPMVTYELVIEGESMVRKAHVPAGKDPKLESGSKVEGWLNDNAKFGIATGGDNRGETSSRNGNRDESIERQTAAKATATVVAGLAAGGEKNPGVLAANFEGIFGSVLQCIKGEGAEQAQSADDQVPF